MRIRLLCLAPVPVIAAEVSGEGASLLPFDDFEFLRKADHLANTNLFECCFRGVRLERLRFVISKGIDVEPPDSVIFTSDFPKAWEYGEIPKLILALDPQRLEPTFRDVPSDTPQEELRQLRDTYPTEICSRDGTRIWLSRLGRDDTRVASPYEVEYARWIPGDPFEALRAAMVFGVEFDQLVEDVSSLLVGSEGSD